MLDTPTIVQTDTQPTAVIRLKIRRDQIREVMGPGMQELMQTLAAQRIAPTGPLFSHHFRMDPEVFDFEIGAPVATPVSPAGRVQPGELPGVRVARAVYTGPYEGLGEAWGEFGDWIASEGHRAALDLWECYANGPESGPDPATWRTELNRPLEAQ